jgi:F-type H+-transporting ATPase subunit b
MAQETDLAATQSVENVAKASAATAGQHEGTATTAAEAHSSGLPQFEFQHWAGQIAYLLILFAVLYVLMAKVFAPRIRRVFDERKQTIDEAISSARSVQAEADAQAEQARQALVDARSSAQKTAAEAKARANAASAAREAALEEELSAKQAEAETRIRAARDAAMQQLTTVATDAAQAMVEKLTGATVSRAAVAAAVNQG